MLCFSSDYPHWDTDAPSYAAAIFPERWCDRIFHENARSILRLPDRAAAA